MNDVVAALAVALAGVAGASEDCPFDQEHQEQVLTEISTTMTGAKLDVEQRQVSWTTPDEGTTTFAYGGCADLGSIVTRSTPLSAPRSQSEVLALAKGLAERFWANDIVSAHLASTAMIAAIDGSTFSIEVIEGKTLFNIVDPDHVQLYVAHEYKDGVDVVSIAWQGNY